MSEESDVVPESHATVISHLEVIENWGLNYNSGKVIDHLACGTVYRSHDGLFHLCRAMFYLMREIMRRAALEGRAVFFKNHCPAVEPDRRNQAGDLR